MPRRHSSLLLGLMLTSINMVACHSNSNTPAGSTDANPIGKDAVAETGGNRDSGGAIGNGGGPGSGGLVGSGGKPGSGGATGGATSRDANPDIALGSDGEEGSRDSGDQDLTQGFDGVAGVCPTGWQLAWSDEFDGSAGAQADSSKWVYETGNGSGGWGNAELEYYRAENGVLDGRGNLVITTKQETASGFQYTSARLKTQGKAGWTYGHIEARIKIPYGQGLWPAFWMLGTDISTNSWPKCGEIDIMENIGKEPSINHGSLHMPASGTSNDSDLSGSYTLKNAKLSDDFHTYAIEWSSDSIQFFFDGNLYETQTPAAATGRTWEFDKPFFILLNVAVGGTWPGSPDSSTTFPQTMTVDYVRVCQR